MWYYADDFHWLYLGEQALKTPSLIISHTIFNYFRPVINMSFWFEALMYGSNATAHHLFNLFIHFLTSIILFGVVRRLTDSNTNALFTAILFTIAPGSVEAVLWISGRIDLLSTLFYISSILLQKFYYISHLENEKLMLIL
jgi:hypothetical protein